MNDPKCASCGKFNCMQSAPTTVLVVKDRVTGHNPAAALYTSHFYYRKLFSV